jgi:hypothetical protein
MEQHNIKVAVIQESKLMPTSRTKISIPNFTTVRKDRLQDRGGGLIIFIHKTINFSQRPTSAETATDNHLEELTISVKLGNQDLIISNVYIPQRAPVQVVTNLPSPIC